MIWLIICLFLLLVGAAAYLKVRQYMRAYEATRPVDPMDEYLDAVETEAYYRIRTMLDADQVIQHMRKEK